MSIRKFGKIVSRIALILLGIILLLIAVAKVLQNKIVQKAIAELNKSISSPVFVDDASFSLLKRFPQATIQFTNVSVLSGKGFNAGDFRNADADTLAQIKNIFVAIDLFAILENTLEVKKIEINGAKLNVLIDKKGNNNYQIFDLPEESTSNDSILLNINVNEVHFVKSKINFNNLYKKNQFALSAPNFKAKGAWGKNAYSLSTQGDLLLSSLNIGSTHHHPRNPASIKLNMRFANDTLSLYSSKILTRNAQFILSGYAVLANSIYTDINIKGNKISIRHLLQLLPIKEELSDFSSNGYLDFNGLIKGNLSNKQSPYLLANFGVSSANITYKDSIHLNDVNLKGRFSNGKKRNKETMSLSLKEFSFKTDSSVFSGSFSLNNFQKPEYLIKSDFNLNLDEFSPLLTQYKIYGVSGNVKGQLKTKGQWQDSIVFDSIQNALNNTYAKLAFSSLNFNLPEQGLFFNNINSTIFYNQNIIRCDSISGFFNNMKMEGESVRVENLFDALKTVQQNPLSVYGNFYIDTVEYIKVKHLFKSDDETSDPLQFNISGTIVINNYQHNRANFQKLTSVFYLNNNDFCINKLHVKAFGGEIFTNIRYQVKNEKEDLIKIKAQTNKIDVASFFRTFDNFGQENLTHENLKGNLTSDFECEFKIINNKVVMESIELLGYTKLENGRLINYKPVEELARFTNLEELNNLSFSTIETDLLVSSNTVHFPQMDVTSNAFDISLFGKQELAGDYEYHIKIYLSDIISGKTKKLQKQQSEFGEIVDDGLGRTSLFLVSTKEKGKVKTRFDRKQLRKHLQNEFVNEKQELKQLFKEEYNWFNSDSTAVKPKKEEESTFEIEWDDF